MDGNIDDLLKEIDGVLGTPSSRTDRRQQSRDGQITGAEIDDLLNGEQGPKIRRFFDAVKTSEGGQPNLIVGGQKTFDPNGDHPNTIGLRTAQGPSTAAGNFQITGDNWYNKGLKRRLGAKNFNPENQLRGAIMLFADRNKRRGLNALLNDDYETAEKVAALDWAALPSSQLHPKKFDQNKLNKFLSLARGERGEFLPNTDFSSLIKDIDAAIPQPQITEDYTDLLSEINSAIGDTNFQENTPPSVGDGLNVKTDLRTGNILPNKPVAESDDTIQSQLDSAMNIQSPRAGVLLTEQKQFAQMPKEAQKLFTPIFTKSGNLLVNNQKAKERFGLKTPKEIHDYVVKNGFAGLIGKVEDVGDQTADGLALRTETNGIENSTSIVSPGSIEAQAAVDAASFPNATKQEVLPAQEAIKKREAETIETLGEIPGTENVFPEAVPQNSQTLADIDPDIEKPVATDADYQSYLNYKSITDSPEVRAEFDRQIASADASGFGTRTGAEKYALNSPDLPSPSQSNKPKKTAITPTKRTENTGTVVIENKPQAYAPATYKNIQNQTVGTAYVDLSKKPAGVRTNQYLLAEGLRKANLGLSDEEINDYVANNADANINDFYDRLEDKDLPATLKGLQSNYGDTNVQISIPQRIVDEIKNRRPEFAAEKERLRNEIGSTAETKRRADEESALREQAIRQLREDKADPSLWTTGGIGTYAGDLVGDAVFGDEAKEPTEEEISRRVQELKNSRIDEETRNSAKSDAAWLNSNAGKALDYISPLFSFLPDDTKNAIGASATGGYFNSVGSIYRTLAGVARPFSGSAYQLLSRVADKSETLGASTGVYNNKKNAAVSEIFKIAGATPNELAKLYLVTRGGGMVIGMGVDGALQEAGRGGSMSDIQRGALKGAATGLVFEAAPIGGKAIENLVSNTVAKPIVREVATLGYIGGGTAVVETLSGTPPEQAIKAGIVNGAFHLLNVGTNLVGKTIRAKDSQGNSVSATVTADSKVKLLKGEVQKPDIEMVLDPTDGVYKNAPEVAANRGNKFEPKENPRELLGENPKRIEVAQPEAVQKVALDTRAQKITENIKDGKTYTVEQIQKATKYNKNNVEETLLNLYSAKQIEILPDNSIRFIGGESSLSSSKSLFERAGEIEKPKENINLPKSSIESEIGSSDSAIKQPSNKNNSQNQAVSENLVAKDVSVSNEKADDLSIYEALPQQKRQETQAEKPKAKLDYAEPENIAEKLNVFTERGRKASVQPKVVEQSDLLTSMDEGYPQEFQPRDRSRAASKAQVSEIANRLNPEFLGDSPKASDGRPLVVPVTMPDGKTKYAVISGNGRTAGIREAYNLDNDGAKSYKNFANSKGSGNLNQPVYVGVMNPNEIADFSEFAKEANESATAQMSASEQAKSDADRLDASVLNLFVPSDDGTIHGAANRDFVRSFLDKTTSTSERNRYIDSEGKLNQEGVTKVKNAIFAKAFGGSEMGMATLQRMSESTDSNIKNITNALLSKAGELSSFAEAAKDNRRFKDADIAPDFARAMEKYSELKEAGTSIDEYIRQGALFGADTSPLQTRVMQVFDFYKRRSKSIKTVIDNYIKAAEALGDPNQQSLFGFDAPPSKESIFEGAVRAYEIEDRQSGETEEVGLFDGGERRENESEARRESDGDAQKPESQGREKSESSVNVAAHEAATSPHNDLPEPTTAQREAGNYKLGHANVNGLDISIEIPTGGTRSGTSRSGVKWTRTMQSHYGHIKRTVGAETENLDVFVKDQTPDDFSGDVFIVDQIFPDTGKFDEHKILIGFDSLGEAKKAYLSNYADNWQGLGNISAMPFDEFKDWTRSEQKKPVAPSQKLETAKDNTTEKVEKLRTEIKNLSQKLQAGDRFRSPDGSNEIYTVLPSKNYQNKDFYRLRNEATGETFDQRITSSDMAKIEKLPVDAPLYSRPNAESLLAPNGKPSNLTSFQYKQVRTPEFKKFFGDWENDPENASKVVDENGEPMVVYHNTREEFDVFKNKGRYGSVDHIGYFFGDQESSQMFGNGIELETYLNIRNPHIEDVSANIRELEDEYPEDLIAKWRGETADDFETGRSAIAYFDDNIHEIYERVEEEGNDGIIVYGTDGSLNVVALESNQIKSATDNNGEFSAENDSILRYYDENSTELENDLIDTLEKNFGLESLQKARIKPDGKINEEAFNLISRAHQIAFDLTAPPIFFGSYLNPENTRKIRAALDNIFSSGSEAGRRAGDNFLKQFDAAVDPKHGDAIHIVTSRNAPNGLKRAEQEEKAHRADYRVGGSHSVGISVIQSNYAGHRAMRNLQNGAYKGVSNDTAAMEVAAKLFVDGETETGLSKQDRKKIMKQYHIALANAGITADDMKQFSEISNTGEKFARKAERYERIQRSTGIDGQAYAATTKEGDSTATSLREVWSSGLGLSDGRIYREPENFGSDVLEGTGKVSATESVRQRSFRETDEVSAENRRHQDLDQYQKPENTALVKASPQDLAKTEEFFDALDFPLYSLAPKDKNTLATIFAPIWKGDRTTSVKDIATNFRRAGLLTAPKTHLKNIVSNTLFQASEEAARPVAILADLAASAVTGQRTVQMPNIASIYKSFAAIVRQDETLKALDEESGIRRAWNILKNGDIAELEKNQLEEMRSGSPVLDTFVNYTFRALGAEDALFKTYAMRRSLEESAATIAATERRDDKSIDWRTRRNELLNDPTPEMILEAELAADFSTFTNDNPISDAFRDIKNSNDAVKFVAETLVPYDKTPTNVVLRALEYTPLGFGWAGKHLYDLKKGDSYAFNQMKKKRNESENEIDAAEKETREKINRKFADNIKKLDELIGSATTDAERAKLMAEKARHKKNFEILKGKRKLEDGFRDIDRQEIQDAMDTLFSRKAQQDFAKSFGRAGLGSAALGLGIYLAMNGILSGIWDAGDRDEINEFYDRREKGILNASLKIGNHRFVIGDTPLGKTLSIGASIWERSQKRPKKDETPAAKTANDIYKVGKMTVMEQPLLNSLDDYFGSGKTAEKRIGGLLGSFVPSIAAAVADVADDEARDNSKWYSGINRVPVLRNYSEKTKKPREKYLRNRTNRFIDKFDPVNSRPVK